MSETNLEIVRRSFETLGWTPAEVQARVARFYDPDADYYPVRKFPEARPCHGHDEIVQFILGYNAAWGRVEFAIRDLIEVGDDRVLVCGSLHAEGRESHLPLGGDVYYCIWLRHGRCFREEHHLTIGGALHALGLQDQTLEAAGLKAARPEE
jgi:hypothetical protein